MKIELDVSIARQDPLLIRASFSEGHKLRTLYLGQHASTLTSSGNEAKTESPVSPQLMDLRDIFFRMLKEKK